ncbi:MAG: Camelysin metallo-endopeptidase [Firmicutes bacterium]|nr:Camelysin metallo-endopeptidase [Bacillota bacterium]
MKKEQGKMIGKGLLIAGASVAIMAVGGIAAYFTATDQLTNAWTVGKIDVELQEPLYDNAAEERENIAPNKDLTKDPQIANTGTNDAYVFLKVTVPKANVMVASQDGTSFAEGLQELFAYTVNDGWTRVDYQESESENTYIYAYGTPDQCTALAPNEKTSVFFKNSKITFINVLEEQGLEGTTLEMPVEAFAIQTTDLTDSDTSDPEQVWSILSGQIGAREGGTDK